VPCYPWLRAVSSLVARRSRELWLLSKKANLAVASPVDGLIVPPGSEALSSRGPAWAGGGRFVSAGQDEALAREATGYPGAWTLDPQRGDAEARLGRVEAQPGPSRFRIPTAPSISAAAGLASVVNDVPILCLFPARNGFPALLFSHCR
jgi:hypothetical protein